MKTKLDTVKKLVYDIMYEDERARRDEPYLIGEVIKRKAPRTKGMAVEYFMANYNNFNLPPFESITRFARDFRRDNKELIDQDTKVARKENMEEYRAYFRGGNNGAVARDRIEN